MPGLVVFRRRWSVGSDDLVVPGAFLLVLHFICFVVVAVTLILTEFNLDVLSVKLLFYHLIGYLLILFLSICIEIGICVISMRGSILDAEVRKSINIWIYLKSLIILFDITWLILGIIWLTEYYFATPLHDVKEVFLAIIICNWLLVFITLTTIWCTFDAAGRSWVKMKKYQRSMRETESRFNYKRSNSMNRNWRQRKVMRAYQDSWDHRCRLLFCCMGSSERNRNSFTDIARLLSDFFRELDVVPSDVVAGLVLLRKFQKLEREAIVRQRKNGTYEFLSGVPITERTQFLALNDAKNYDFFQTVIHYMYFAQGAYGWPIYMLTSRANMWHLLTELKCFGCCCGHSDNSEIIQDNCCYCNYGALKKTLQIGDIEIIYVTYHVDVGETPFFVAIDYTQKKIVISIRGTLSMKDILTDLNAEGEVLPLTPPRDDWLGHKGMVQAAIYLRNKLQEENLIEKALNRNPERNTHTFGLVLVGHSLGAGAASILAILLKPEYPTLQCFSYSPPGGLLSMPAVEYTKSFITSVVLGKDVVPRIGLNQMETLRADLINAIQRSVDPKWKTISCSVICCGCGPEPTSVVHMSGKDTHINQYQEERDTARSTSTHPTDSSIALTLHQPLYPPGRIIHIVRHHPKPDENVLKSREPVYQAIWADSMDFDEVLISPVMLQDHMPDKVLAALKKVVTTSGPRKPQRQTSNAFSTTSNEFNHSDIGLMQQDSIDADPELNASANTEAELDVDGIAVYEMPCDAADDVTSKMLTTTTTANITTARHIEHCKRPSQSSYSNLSNSFMLTPTAQHKLCLETSFTNLQNSLEQRSLHAAGCSGATGGSKTSSLAGSIFGRSQLSSATPYDISSIVDDSITTVTRKSPSMASETATVIVNECSESTALASVVTTQPLQQRLKAVAFDMAVTTSTSPTTSAASVLIGTPSPQRAIPRGILQRQHSDKKPKTLPLNALRRASDVPNPVDLLHDDWFGLAPLASPETLSEISSISSRTSVPISLANSIERYLQHMPTYGGGAGGDPCKPPLEDIFESQLHTPKVMRRAPKFSENLSTCAEDTRNLDQYKRAGRVFITFPRIFAGDQTYSLDSSDDSFESAQSLRRQMPTASTATAANTTGLLEKQSSKSADQLDDESTLPHGTPVKKLTFSDSNILADECARICPNCPCNQAGRQTKCCLRTEHTQCASPYSACSTNTGSVDTTFYSANSLLEQCNNVTPTRHVITNGNSLAGSSSSNNSTKPNTNAEVETRPGVLESHFPVLDATKNSPNHKYNEMMRKSDVVGGRVRKRLSSEEFIFTRSDEYPILVQIGAERSIITYGSPVGRKRKGCCVYPAANNLPAQAAAGSTDGASPMANRAFPLKSSRDPTANNESSV